MNASPFFHNFSANEWLIQRLETISATVLASSALCMVLLPPGTFISGFVGMALSYLSVNNTSMHRSSVIMLIPQCYPEDLLIMVAYTGKLVEYDEPTKLMKNEGSLFGQLFKEYWSHYHLTKAH